MNVMSQVHDGDYIISQVRVGTTLTIGIPNILLELSITTTLQLEILVLLYTFAF